MTPAIAERLDRLEQKVDRLSDMTVQLIGIVKATNEKVSALTERVDRLEQKVDQLEARVDRLEQKIDQLEARVDRIEQKVDQLEARVDRLEQKVDRQQQQLDRLVEDVTQLRREMRDELKTLLRSHGSARRKNHPARRAGAFAEIFVKPQFSRASSLARCCETMYAEVDNDRRH